MINLEKKTGINCYEGTVINAVYNSELTYKWGSSNGGRGFTLHIFITKINGESIQKVINIPYAVVEINVYSDGPERYDYLNNKTGYIHSRYLRITSPLYQVNNKVLTTNRSVYLSKNLIQKISINSHYLLTPKKHKKGNGYYHMSDNETMFYSLKQPLIKDLWVLNNEELVDAISSNSIGVNRVMAAV